MRGPFRSLFRTQRLPTARQAAAQVAQSERIYAVGDIHGRADLLARILARIDEDAAARAGDGRRTRLVFLGDYIDRGDNARAVLAQLRAIRDARGDAVRFLRGNHEAALASFLSDPVAGAQWLDFGGRQTLASYGVTLAATSDPAALVAAQTAFRAALGADLAFLDSALIPVMRSGDVIFAHAGVDPGVALNAQTEDALLWGSPRFLAAGGPAGLLVVHGHFDAPEPMRGPGRLGVDTGAYYSGVLTAVRLDAGIAFLSS